MILRRFPLYLFNHYNNNNNHDINQINLLLVKFINQSGFQSSSSIKSSKKCLRGFNIVGVIAGREIFHLYTKDSSESDTRGGDKDFLVSAGNYIEWKKRFKALEMVSSNWKKVF